MERIFEKKYTIGFRECDYRNKLRLSSVLRIFSEISGADLDDRKITRKVLMSHNMVFLVLKIAVQINRLPIYNERITVSTWEQAIKGAQFHRGYRMKDKNGEALMEGHSVWVLADHESHSIINPKKYPFEIFSGEDTVIKCKKTPPFKIVDANGKKLIKKAGERFVRYSDLDANGHVFNGVYADVVCDSLPADFVDKKWLSFQLNFINEAKLGDKWDLFIQKTKEDSIGTYHTAGFLPNGKQGFDFILNYEN